jgi:hypothetical protein
LILLISASWESSITSMSHQYLARNFLISSMTYWSFKSVLFNFHEFEYFCGFLALWSLILFHYNLLGYRGLLGYFSICWGLLYDVGCNLFWRKFHGLRKNVILCFRMKYSINTC